MSEAVVTVLITSIATLLVGSGGILTFISARSKGKTEERASSVLEWKALYDEMRKRLDNQEEDNSTLRTEVFSLKQEIAKMNLELDAYKKSDIYIRELEMYAETLLTVIQPLISEDAYRRLENKKPQRNFSVERYNKEEERHED